MPSQPDPTAHVTPAAVPPAPALPLLLRPGARRAWLALLLALLVLTSGLAFSPAPPPVADTGWDKANHLLAFATLAMVASLAGWPWPGRAWRVAGGLLAYGVFIEVVQAQLPRRSAEWADLLADGAGIALGLMGVAAAAALAGVRSSGHRPPETPHR